MTPKATTSGEPVQEHWDVVITLNRGRFDLGLRDLWQYRDLIFHFVRRNIVVNYSQTVFGPFWYLVQPLTTTAVYTIIFSVVAKVPTDQIAPSLFYLSGIVMWTNFAGNLTGTSDVFTSNSSIFGKVYFPRLVVPLATVLTNFFTLALHVAVFCAVYLYHWGEGSHHLTPWLVFAPLLFVANAVLALSIGLIFSALTTRYRDLLQVINYGVQLGMYVTPVIYPLSQVPERYRVLMALNPVSTTIEIFRLSVFGVGSVSLTQVAVSVAVLIVVTIAGLVLFSRAERSAIDTV